MGRGDGRTHSSCLRAYLDYAVDFDGDGRRDIWNSRGDVLASIANYIRGLGWRGGQSWGQDVLVPQGFDPGFAGLKAQRPTGEWSRLGVRTADAGPLPSRESEASLVMPEGANGPALLVYANFRAIMKWNPSTYFAVSVGYLCRQHGTGVSLAGGWARDASPGLHPARCGRRHRIITVSSRNCHHCLKSATGRRSHRRRDDARSVQSRIASKYTGCGLGQWRCREGG